MGLLDDADAEKVARTKSIDAWHAKLEDNWARAIAPYERALVANLEEFIAAAEKVELPKKYRSRSMWVADFQFRTTAESEIHKLICAAIAPDGTWEWVSKGVENEWTKEAYTPASRKLRDEEVELIYTSGIDAIVRRGLVEALSHHP